MMGLSDGRKSFPIGLAVLIQYRSVTVTQPANQPATQPRCRSYYAQRSGVEPKNCVLFEKRESSFLIGGNRVTYEYTYVCRILSRAVA